MNMRDPIWMLKGLFPELVDGEQAPVGLQQAGVLAAVVQPSHPIDAQESARDKHQRAHRNRR